MGTIRRYKPIINYDLKEIRRDLRRYATYAKDEEIEKSLNEITSLLKNSADVLNMRNLRVDIEKERRRRRVKRMN